MITKNEEQFLVQCLDAARPFVDEIIVFDTGSKDKTDKVAREYGAKVFYGQWENDFSKARNQALSFASGDWIIVLDADEIIHEDFGYLRHVLENTNEVVGFSLIQRNYTNDQSITGWMPAKDADVARDAQGYFDSKIVRVFPRHPKIVFSYPIHEDVSPSILSLGGKIEDMDVTIHHYGQLRGNLEDKRKFYRTICEAAVQANPNDAKAHYDLGRMRAEKNELEAAIESFQTSIRFAPNFTKAHIGLAEAFLKMEEYGQAAVHFEKVIALDTKSADIYSNLGVALVKLRKPSAALEAFDHALVLNPKHVRALHNLIALLLAQNQIPAALKVLDSAWERTQMEKFVQIKREILEKLAAKQQ